MSLNLVDRLAAAWLLPLERGEREKNQVVSDGRTAAELGVLLAASL